MAAGMEVEMEVGQSSCDREHTKRGWGVSGNGEWEWGLVPVQDEDFLL